MSPKPEAPHAPHTPEEHEHMAAALIAQADHLIYLEPTAGLSEAVAAHAALATAHATLAMSYRIGEL
jgi:hypothetical protein